MAELEGDELGSGMGESAQWNLRNHRTKMVSFLGRQSLIPLPSLTNLKVETSPHYLKFLDSVSSLLCSPGKQEKQGHSNSILRPPSKKKIPTITKS